MVCSHPRSSASSCGRSSTSLPSPSSWPRSASRSSSRGSRRACWAPRCTASTSACRTRRSRSGAINDQPVRPLRRGRRRGPCRGPRSASSSGPGSAGPCARWRTTTRPPLSSAFRSRTSGSSSGRRRVSWRSSAGILWGCRIGVQFSLTFLALKALPGPDPRRLHVHPRRDRGRPHRRRQRETRRGLHRARGSAAVIENWFPVRPRAVLFLLVRPKASSARRRIERV